MTALVAPPADTTTALSGAGLLDSISSTATAIENKDWVGAALGGFSTAMDTVAAAMDPIGTLIAWGAGWLLDHLEPLKGWLDDLTGDAGAVAGFAQTWVNVAGRMQEEAAYLTNRVEAEIADLKGEAIEAYRRHAVDLAAHIGGMQQASQAVAGGLQTASTIVQVVHELVRDTLAQIIGSLSSAILQAVCSLGTLIPKVVADVAARVAALAGRIGATVKAVVEALGKLRNLVKKLGELMQQLRQALRLKLTGKVTLRDGSTHVPTFAAKDLPTSSAGRLSVNDSLHDTALFAKNGFDEPWTRDELIAKIHTDPSALTGPEQVVLHEIRDRIGLPYPDDVIQKVMPTPAAQDYLGNVVTPGGRDLNEVRGFVTNASDTAHLDTPSTVYDNLALKQEWGYDPGAASVHALRYQPDAGSYEIPRSPVLGGHNAEPPPFTGNGFTRAPDDVVPELQSVYNTANPVPTTIRQGGEMWGIGAYGGERLLGVFRNGQWVRVR